MKISPLLSRIISDGFALAKSSRHRFLTPEHLLCAALQADAVRTVLQDSGADIGAIKTDAAAYLERQVPHRRESGEPEQSDGSRDIAESAGFQSVMNRAACSCIDDGRNIVDIADLLISLFDERRNFCSFYMRIHGVRRSVLESAAAKLRTGQQEAAGSSAEFGGSEAGSGTGAPRQQFRPALERFAVNLTEQAKGGAFDELIGREEELARTIQVLCRRTKNNPLHVGDAGVGKTAVTQGLARRIAAGDVPDDLKGAEVFSLDVGLLLAGAKFRGDFEERLHSVVEELAAKRKAVLFIDEIHMIMGAGTNGNTAVDAANLLKPALADGKIRCIGSTTFEEYARHFEKDRALVRRFQKIDINEPDRDEAVRIVRGLLPRYERHHGVRYGRGAAERAVDLSVQYLADRRLPDKALDVIDEAGAFVKIRFHGARRSPPERAQDAREAPSGVPVVSLSAVRRVVSKMAGVPVEAVSGGERERLRRFQERLSGQIFGQDEAVAAVSAAVKKARAGLKSPEKPEASFLFVGPTGVGKTELARALADALGEPLLRFDMSEYQERHSASRLVGSPPGYVGYDEGGVLTDGVRKNPHSVVLFDEIEKAHSDIYSLFLQVMDYGFLTDSRGRKADFRNCIVIMTSNAGARELEKGRAGFGRAG
ncbi:MAG: AAA family ATPase, partial [Treponemataceae bacterium]|nr:AAA family ATPase [Treponemataceae bacterium]